MDTCGDNNNNDNHFIVDNKQNVILALDKTDQSYFLSMKLNGLSNSRIDIDELLTYKIYTLIEKLNSDIIERITVIDDENNNTKSFLIVFKPIGCEIGLKQKYMCMRTVREKTDNIVSFKSLDFDISRKVIEDNGLQRMEKMVCHFANIYIKLDSKIGDNSSYICCDVSYFFKITQSETLPKYMQHLIGLMMKKILLNVKTFVEKV